MKKYLFILAAVICMPSASYAEGDTQCAVNYTRTACTGEEATSFKKCDGNASCTKYKEADSADACRVAAMKSCRNRRLNITQAKVITAKWQGAELLTASGNSDFCVEYEKRAEEFNHCDES